MAFQKSLFFSQNGQEYESGEDGEAGEDDEEGEEGEDGEKEEEDEQAMYRGSECDHSKPAFSSPSFQLSCFLYSFI